MSQALCEALCIMIRLKGKGHVVFVPSLLFAVVLSGFITRKQATSLINGFVSSLHLRNPRHRKGSNLPKNIQPQVAEPGSYLQPSGLPV